MRLEKARRGQGGAFGATAAPAPPAPPATALRGDPILIDSHEPGGRQIYAFTVTDGENALEGATIAIAGQTLTTDAAGAASVELPNGEYAYVVTKDGATAEGSVVVDGEDVSVEVVLVPVGVETLTAAMRLYPNPVSDVLAIELPVSESVTIEIFSETGLKVMSVDSDAAATRVDVSGLPAGAYFARAAGHDGLQVLRFVKY